MLFVQIIIFFYIFFLMTIPIDYRISDTRSLKSFNKKTFGNFLVKDVVNAFNKALMTCKLEESCNWAVELLISGLFDKFWDKVFSIFLKNININNPNLPFFIYKRYSKFLVYYRKYDNKLELRNNQVIRNMFCEICCVLCSSVKLKSIGFSKIENKDFNMGYLSTKMKADSNKYVSDKIKYGDPNELNIIMNEFNYNLVTKNYELSSYWMSWVFEFEKKNTSKNKTYICAYREIDGIDTKFKHDICWFFWEILIKEAQNKDEDFKNNIESLFKLYKNEFKPSKKSKKNYLLLLAVKYFTDIYKFSNKLIGDYSVLIQATSNINNIFINKINGEVNKYKDYNEKKKYEDNVPVIKKENEVKKKKEELKKLKEIADLKMKHKISTVEKIDSLILNGKI